MAFSCETIRKARKEHRCESCGIAIPIGQYYRIWAGTDDMNEVSSSKYCRFCSCLIYHFSDKSYYENTDIFDISEYDGLIKIINDNDGEPLYSSIFLKKGCEYYPKFMEEIIEFNRNKDGKPFIIKKPKYCTMPLSYECKYRRDDNTCKEFYNCAASSFDKPEVN